MTIPQLNQEIRRLEPLEHELWLAHKRIVEPSEKAWYAVVREINTLKKQRIELIEQITADTASATV